MGNQYLSLSLFLMLLSFFIVLNAMSDFDESKVRPALSGLSLAFSKQENLPQEMKSGAVNDTADLFREGDTLDRIEGLFRAHISGIDVAKNRLGTVMHIRVPLEVLDEKLTAFSNQSGGADASLTGLEDGSFTPMLLSLMQSDKNEPYRMDMVFNIGEKPSTMQAQKPQALQNAVLFASQYAEMLELTGLDKRLMTVGLGAGEDKTVDLFFYRYVPYNPLGDGQAGAGQATAKEGGGA